MGITGLRGGDEDEELPELYNATNSSSNYHYNHLPHATNHSSTEGKYPHDDRILHSDTIILMVSCAIMIVLGILLLIHSADPQSRPAVIIVFAHVVRPSPLFKTKQISSRNKVRYWRDCGSGRVDH